MTEPIAIAIETSCRQGGVAVGIGPKLTGQLDFDASRRHAAQVVSYLDDLLKRCDLTPRDVHHLYVSVGPGGFTGLRVGIMAARTMAQFIPAIQCVAVPTPLAVAENLRDAAWERLGIVLDAGSGQAHAAVVARQDGQFVIERTIPATSTGQLAEQLAQEPNQPILLTGEGLGYHDLAAAGFDLANEAAWLPTAEGVWRVGRQLALAAQFTSAQQLLPVYARRPNVTQSAK
ncbi:MAG: tRNA (adenosine(37)-N6)-threonylcarbamoyltransferase complex dimerization subunit type 1 TsaB [Planctomycetota bacterium]|jgi:tRNA threonylcarbamoyladenosine biosynthesis protein TsaB